MESQQLICYWTINFLVTLIWWTIPMCMAAYREKYNLPPKWVIWPMKVGSFIGTWVLYDNFKDKILVAMVGLLLGTILPAIPLWVLVTKVLCLSVNISVHIVHIVHIVFRWCIATIAFSKEEKVQIAVGSIEKKMSDV